MSTEQAKAWEEIFDHCLSLGMDVLSGGKTAIDDVKDFISGRVVDASNALEDGTTVELSEESYKALKEGVS